MSHKLRIELQLPDDLARLRLPPGVQARLQHLLDRENQGASLSDDERHEAEGLVQLSELLSLIRLQVEQLAG